MSSMNDDVQFGDKEIEPIEKYKKKFPLGSHINDKVVNHLVHAGDTYSQMFPFPAHFVRRLLHNKHIVFIGDSLTRAIYKDLIFMLKNNDTLIDGKMLKKKTEHSHCGDKQIDMLPLEQDRVFRQAREYQSATHLIQYLFTTRVMKEDVEKALLQFSKRKEYPDVILMNSALWDLTRYNVRSVNMANVRSYTECPRGQIENEVKSMEEYLERLSMLMRRMRVILPPYTQVIWLCMPYTLPDGTKSMMYNPGSKDKRSLHRSVYCDGNYRAAQVVRNAGYDVLDLGFYMRNHGMYCYRTPDCVHWDPVGTRFMTQLIMGHLSLNVDLPPFIKERLVRFKQNMDSDLDASVQTKIPNDVSASYQLYSSMDANLNPLGVRENGGEAHVGPFFEKHQQDLCKGTLDAASREMREAIIHDIETMRAVELCRTSNVTLDPESAAKLLERAKAAPKVVSREARIFNDECQPPPQKIKVLGRRQKIDNNRK